MRTVLLPCALLLLGCASTSRAPGERVGRECVETRGRRAPYVQCDFLDDCPRGFVCTGKSRGDAYCRALCTTDEECAPWQAKYPSVVCMPNRCAGSGVAVGVCNDQPEDELLDCCDAPVPVAKARKAEGGNFPGGVGRVTLTHGAYTLHLWSRDPALTAPMAERLVRTYFLTIGRAAERFNPDAPRVASLVVDPAFTRTVAETSKLLITASASWLTAHPDDADFLTHEVMHLVQAYRGPAPAHWVEGVADYGRFHFGLENASWSLTPWAPGQRYTDSYRVTARFLVWLERHVKADVVLALDRTLRAGKYDDHFWVEQTSHTVDELWARYAAAPEL